MKRLTLDIEFDGPVVGKYSIIGLSAYLVSEEGVKSFDRKVKPIFDNYEDSHLGVLNLTREDTLKEDFEDAELVFMDFHNWCKIHVTQGPFRNFCMNPSTDFAFLNYYFHEFVGYNPLGYSAHCINTFTLAYNRNLTLKSSAFRKKINRHEFGDAKNDYSIIEGMLNEIERNRRR